jgi:hypothetical protein
MKTKKLLVIEGALLCILAAPLIALVLLHSYTFHFEQVTLNFYTNGKADFSTDATNLVRSLGTIALLALIFGVTTGAAFGLTLSTHLKAPNSTTPSAGYEEEMAKAGFVVINKTTEGTTYRLTEIGRRFLREYRFLEKTEENVA